MIHNPINELSDDDEDYVPSNDTSFTFNDNNDRMKISIIEMAKRFNESEGMTIQTSSDDSSLAEKFYSSSANSTKS